MCASVSDPRGLIGHDLVRTVVARRSMRVRVRVRVRLRAARARAWVRASVVRAGHVSKPVEPSQMLMTAMAGGVLYCVATRSVATRA